MAGLISKIKALMALLYEVKSCKKFIPRAELEFRVHLAEHCNLNCKGCDNFSCIAEKGFLDLNEYERDLKRLSELSLQEASYIHLLGGEPLLHPDVPRAVSITRQYFPQAEINIYTNGMLLPKQGEDFWQTLKDNNVGIIITPYPTGFDYSAVHKTALSHGASYRYTGASKASSKDVKDYVVTKTLFHFTLDMKGKQNGRESFIKCHRANNCIMLKKGRLYTCTIAPNIEHFNKRFNKNLPVTARNSIDIYKAKDLDEILAFLARPIPFCRFCNIDAESRRFQWETTKAQMSEWT